MKIEPMAEKLIQSEVSNGLLVPSLLIDPSIMDSAGMDSFDVWPGRNDDGDFPLHIKGWTKESGRDSRCSSNTTTSAGDSYVWVDYNYTNNRVGKYHIRKINGVGLH